MFLCTAGNLFGFFRTSSISAQCPLSTQSQFKLRQFYTLKNKPLQVTFDSVFSVTLIIMLYHMSQLRSWKKKTSEKTWELLIWASESGQGTVSWVLNCLNSTSFSGFCWSGSCKCLGLDCTSGVKAYSGKPFIHQFCDEHFMHSIFFIIPPHNSMLTFSLSLVFKM